MARVKRGTTSLKTRRSVLKRVKGYRFGRSTKERQAREAIAHAGNHAFAHRRRKKGDFRRLWTVKLNAALRPLDISYSTFIDLLKKKNVVLDRKVLSQIAHEEPEAFKRIVETVK
jgi:large subunit ribosomal protein L20